MIGTKMSMDTAG